MEPTPLSLELVPLDQPQAPPPAQETSADIEIAPLGTIKAVDTARAAKGDRFLQEATRQYAEGHTDQPLWDRAFAQANGDKEAATETYLRARATALRLLDRERRTEQRKHATPATREASDDATTADTNTTEASKRLVPRRAFARYRNAIIVAGALVPLIVGGWLLSSDRNAVATTSPVLARTNPVNEPAVAQSQAAAVAAGTSTPSDMGSQPGTTAEFKKKVQELSDAGNWNVLVLYAVEWTRREPANPAAWSQLRAGYVNLRQYDEALGAASKAVQLAPEDPGTWRSLGEINMKVDDLPEALRAYEEAAARNSQDVESLMQIAILNVRSGRVQEAKVALDRALAISPHDATALCLRSSVAQLPRSQKDANATAAQVKAIASKCQG